MKTDSILRLFLCLVLAVGFFAVSTSSALAVDSKLVAGSVGSWSTTEGCMPRDAGDPCVPNVCSQSTRCWEDWRGNEHCDGVGCGFGGGSTTFYWDGVSNVWISGLPFSNSFTPATMLAGPQDNRKTCDDVPLLFGGSGRCDFNGYNGLAKGSMLIDDKAVFTINGFSINTHYNQEFCEWVNARSAIRLNDNSPLKYSAKDNTDYYHQGSIPAGTLKPGLNTISVSYSDYCGSDYRSQTPIYIVTDGSFSPQTPTPNCSALTGPTTLILGQTGTYTANFSTPGAAGSLRGAIEEGNFHSLQNQTFSGLTGSITDAKFTPSAVGTYNIWCRAWNDGIAECRDSAYVDAPPRYACVGPNTHLTVTVTPPETMNLSVSPFEDSQTVNGCKDSGELLIGSSWSEGANLSLIVGGTVFRPTIVGGTYKFLNIPVGFPMSLSVASNAIPSGYSTYIGYDNGGTGRCGSSPAISTNKNYTNLFVGFTKNNSWLRAYNADVYARNSYKISIPPLTIGLVDNYLINGPGAGFAATGEGSSIITYLTNPPNRTSINGWEVNNYLGGMKYFKNLIFGLNYPALNWNSLAVNSFYSVNGDLALPSNYTFTNADRGVAVIYVNNGNVTINGDFKNTRATGINSQGVIIVATGKITINPSSSATADEIDAVLISNDVINATDNNPSPRLNVYGALYAKNGLGLPRQLVNNNVDAAINVYLQPIYFFTNSKDLNRPTISNWRELTPSE